MRKSITLMMLLSIILVLNACTYKYERQIPEEGVWCCAELQAQFTFGNNYDATDSDDAPIIDENENYVIIDGDRIASLCGKRYGASKITIICQEADRSDFYLGEIIYSMSFVSRSDAEFVLEDDDGKQYTFKRIGDTPVTQETLAEG